MKTFRNLFEKQKQNCYHPIGKHKVKGPYLFDGIILYNINIIVTITVAAVVIYNRTKRNACHLFYNFSWNTNVSCHPFTWLNEKIYSYDIVFQGFLFLHFVMQHCRNKRLITTCHFFSWKDFPDASQLLLLLRQIKARCCHHNMKDIRPLFINQEFSKFVPSKTQTTFLWRALYHSF